MPALEEISLSTRFEGEILSLSTIIITEARMWLQLPIREYLNIQYVVCNHVFTSNLVNKYLKI